MADTVVADLVARLRADTTGFSSGLKGAEKDAQSFAQRMSGIGSSLQDAGRGMTLGFTVPFVAGMGLAIKAASSLEEAQNKSNVIFGQSSAVINRWAAGAAKDFGLSTRAALSNASSFGNMFSQLGIGGPKVTQMSQRMVELASDFASFHDADITEVLLAQQAAFRGEYDAVQRFVPTINAAAVETKALAMSGKENAKELTAQDKAMAAYTLMVEGAGEALGDFDRTSGSAANQMRTARAELENAAATIGAIVLPMFADLVGVVADAASFIAGLPKPVQSVIVAFGALVAAAGPVLWVTGSLIKNVSAIAEAAPGAAGAIAGIAKGAAGLGVLVTVGVAVAKALDAIQGDAYNVEVSVDSLSNHSKRLSRELGSMREQLEKWKATAESADPRSAADIMRRYGGEIDSLVGKVRKLASESPELARQFVEQARAAGLPEPAIRKLSAAVDSSEASMVKASIAADKDAENLNRLKASADGAAKSVEELRAEFDAIIDAQFGVEGAAIRMDKAMVDFTASMAEGKQGTIEGRQALLDAKESAVAYGRAVYEAYSLAGAVADDAKAMQIAALTDVANSLDDGSPVRTALNEYIWMLGSVPRNIDTILSIQSSADSLAQSVIGSASGWVLNRRAMGGPVSAGSPYLVGEEGPELFVPGASGSIVPNGALSGGGGSAGGVETLVLQFPFEGRMLTEVVVSNLNRAGGPKVSQKAIAN